MRENATREPAATMGRGRRAPVVVGDLVALFVASFICHLVPFAVYIMLTSGPGQTATAITGLHAFWPVLLGMAAVAVFQSTLWSLIPAGRPYLLGTCFGLGFLVEAPVIVVLLIVPGWLLLAPFFLMGGLAACIAAAALIVRRTDARTKSPHP